MATVLRAHQRVRERHPGAQLLLAGLGVEEDRLKDLARNLFSDDPAACRFLGYVVEPEEKERLYAEADVLVLASLAEGFPRVIYEAMAIGVPVVASNILEIAGALPPESVLLVEPRSPEAVARGLLAALDPERTREMCAAGRIVAERVFGADPVDIAEELLLEAGSSQ